MSQWLKYQSAPTIQLGPFLDETDGKTAETALTIAYTACYVSKNGGSFAAKNDNTNLTGTGDSLGYYDAVLNSTDTGTLGRLRIHVHVAGALPVWQDFMVVPANVYESLITNVEFLETTSLKPDWSISSTTLTVKMRDDSTTQFQKTITSTPGADPITGLA